MNTLPKKDFEKETEARQRMLPLLRWIWWRCRCSFLRSASSRITVTHTPRPAISSSLLLPLSFSSSIIGLVRQLDVCAWLRHLLLLLVFWTAIRSESKCDSLEESEILLLQGMMASSSLQELHLFCCVESSSSPPRPPLHKKTTTTRSWRSAKDLQSAVVHLPRAQFSDAIAALKDQGRRKLFLPSLSSTAISQSGCLSCFLFFQDNLWFDKSILLLVAGSCSSACWRMSEAFLAVWWFVGWSAQSVRVSWLICTICEGFQWLINSWFLDFWLCRWMWGILISLTSKHGLDSGSMTVANQHGWMQR